MTKIPEKRRLTLELCCDALPTIEACAEDPTRLDISCGGTCGTGICSYIENGEIKEIIKRWNTHMRDRRHRHERQQQIEESDEGKANMKELGQAIENWLVYMKTDPEKE